MNRYEHDTNQKNNILSLFLITLNYLFRWNYWILTLSFVYFIYKRSTQHYILLIMLTKQITKVYQIG